MNEVKPTTTLAFCLKTFSGLQDKQSLLIPHRRGNTGRHWGRLRGLDVHRMVARRRRKFYRDFQKPKEPIESVTEHKATPA